MKNKTGVLCLIYGVKNESNKIYVSNVFMMTSSVLYILFTIILLAMIHQDREKTGKEKQMENKKKRRLGSRASHNKMHSTRPCYVLFTQTFMWWSKTNVLLSPYAWLRALMYMPHTHIHVRTNTSQNEKTQHRTHSHTQSNESVWMV